MATTENLDEAIEVLQQLGLKEYEARCFVGLTRLNSGTAKKLSDLTEVPRTRVYDAIRVLEAKGLVEIHHSSPQRFRAAPLEEATETLRDQYEARVERLRGALDGIEIVDADDESPVQEIWSMTGKDAIENRAEELISKATSEVVFVVGDEAILSEDLVDTFNDIGTGIDLIIGTVGDELQDQIRLAVPQATTFISGLDWLHGENTTADDTAIGRLLLIDRSTILVSSIMPKSKEEQAIFGGGFGNGLIVIARRLMAQGLLDVRDPKEPSHT